MAARFPQSATPISGKRIPPALVSAGVKAVIWAATADSVHVLLAGQTTTTLLTRTPGGATYNSTDGRISGTVTGNGTSQYFALAVVGGIGVVANDYVEIVSYFGDTGVGWPTGWMIGSDDPTGVFGNWEGVRTSTFAQATYKGPGGIYQVNFSGSGAADYSNGSNDFCVFGLRSNQGDSTAKHRAWCNGQEDNTLRSTGALADTTALGSSAGRPIYFGGTNANTAGGVGIYEFEAALIGTGAIDAATMDALTAKAGPLTWIEDAPAAPTLSAPSGTATGPTQATIGVTSDTAPTTTPISYQILPAATAAPDAPTIVGAPDGTISTGSAGALTKAITGLTTNTAVKVHFAQGASSNVVSSASFTPNTLASSGSPSAQSGTAGASFTWAGATPDSLITNHGNGAGAWSIVSSAGFTVAPSINTSTGVLSGGTLDAAGSYAPQIRYTDSSSVPAAQTITLTLGLTVAAAGGGVTFSGTVPAKTGTAGAAFSWGSPALSTYFSGAGTYSVQSGNLAALGLSLDANTGVISGANPIAGTQAIVIRKTASSGSPATADTNSFNITISAALATSLTLTLYGEDGTTPSANRTGLKWAFFDQVTPDLFDAPSAQGSGASTNGSGALTLNITGTSLAPGATGWLTVSNSDGTVQTDGDLDFSGPAVVS